MATLKGQNFRILTFNKSDNKFYCVGMSTNCTVTLNNNADDASTKDDTDDFARNIALLSPPSPASLGRYRWSRST